MALQKLFSLTAKNQLQLVALLMKGNQRLVLLLFPTFRGVMEPIKRILNSHNVKVASKNQTLGHIFAIYSIPCNDYENEYVGQTKRQFGTRLK